MLLEYRNVTQAAEQLHLTQSAMSRQLSQLRVYFSDPLLIREGNDYLVSARAKQLLPKVQGILDNVDALRDEDSFDPTLCKRRFTFACTDYVAQFLFPKLLSRLQQEAPGIDIIYEMWKPEWLAQLGQGPLDFASIVTPNVPENLSSIYLGQDAPVCLMAQDHPLADEQIPALHSLLEYPFVKLNSGSDKDSFFDRHLEASHPSRRILFEVPFFSAAFQVVANNQALMVLPEHIAQTAGQHLPLTYRPLPFAPPENNYHLCWHKVHDQDKAHAWVRHCISEELRVSMQGPNRHAQKS